MLKHNVIRKGIVFAQLRPKKNDRFAAHSQRFLAKPKGLANAQEP